MPTQKRPGLTGVYVELPDEMVRELEELCERLPIGGKADHIRLAVRRHLAHPPAVVVPQLPPETVTAKGPPSDAKPKGRGKKKG